MANNLKRTEEQRRLISEGMKRSWARRKRKNIGNTDLLQPRLNAKSSFFLSNMRGETFAVEDLSQEYIAFLKRSGLAVFKRVTEQI